MSEEKKGRTLDVTLKLPESTVLSLIRWEPDAQELDWLGDIPYDICVVIHNILTEKIKKALFEEE